jgi:iron complex outermembrane receptor protein
MKAKAKQLHVAMARALGVAMALGAPSVWSQAQTAQTKERIEVTGSNIKRVEGESALPVTVITRDEIERTGATNAVELLNIISANNSLGTSALNSVIGATTYSAQTASLRGLGGAHTLVLINGKRINGFAGEVQGIAGVNLGIIPFSAIDRVEILKDGASAVYGSDAIAGVINFIMRSDYRGAEAMAFYGAPTRSGGGQQEKYSGSFGFGDLYKDRYNVFFNASYDHQHSLDQVDRNFSNDSTIEFLRNLGGFAGSSNTFPGRVSTGGIGMPGHVFPDCGGQVWNVAAPPDLQPFIGAACYFDPARMPGVQSIPDDKAVNLYAQGKFQLTTNWQLYGHALYGEDKNHFVIQPVPISNLFFYGPNGDIPSTVTIRPSSPFYPTAAAIAAGVNGQPLNVRYRAYEAGMRDTTDTNSGYQVVGGFKGTLMDRWDADLSYSYAEGKVVDHTNGGFPQYSTTLPLLNGGTVNLFGPNTPAIQEQLRNATFIGDVFTGKASTAAINGKIAGELFNMGTGAVAAAIGFDLRKEKLDEKPDPAYTAGDISGYGGNAHPVKADRDVTAFYGEINVPLLKTLELNAAIRSDDYSDFGRTNNPKASLRWQPNRDLLLRASYGKGFLAPSLYQLFTPQFSGVSPTGQTDIIRCPVTQDTGFDCNTQFAIIFGGNPQLQPEKSEQTTLGVVFEPISALSLSADYFKIRLNNAITNGLPVATILGDPVTYGYLLQRGPVDPRFPTLPGRITGIMQTYINLGTTHIEGIDVEGHYKWPQMGWGRVRLDVSGTYYRRYDFQNLDKSYSGFVSSAAGSPVVGVIPRWKHYASLSWDRGPWTATLANTFQSSYTDWGTDLNGNERTVSTLSLWDVQGTYSGLKSWTFTVGVKNLMDTNPPATNQQNTFQVGYDPSYYDARARFLYGSVRFSFR